MTDAALLPSPSSTPDASSAGTTAKAIHALRAAAAHVERTLGRTLDAHSLTAAQFAALQILHDAADHPMPCSELGAKLTAVAPDVTRLLDRLENGGLVSRNRDPEDRRVVHTRITEKGRVVMGKALPDVRAAEARALADLGLDGQIELARLLSGVQRNCPGN